MSSSRQRVVTGRMSAQSASRRNTVFWLFIGWYDLGANASTFASVRKCTSDLWARARDGGCDGGDKEGV
eukprot:6064622-Prymnesium_polylepis.2